MEFYTRLSLQMANLVDLMGLRFLKRRIRIAFVYYSDALDFPQRLRFVATSGAGHDGLSQSITKVIFRKDLV
jgi:hypothetical protein